MNQFKIATYNANSVRARLPILTEWLVKEQPDILCIQETKVQDKDFPIKPFETAGYRVEFCGQKSYNGVAIASLYDLEAVRKELNDRQNEQARFISATIRGIPVINVYVPQGFAPGTDKFSYKIGWMTDLLEHIQKNYDPKEPLIISGDFNVALEDNDLYDPEGFRGRRAGSPPFADQAIPGN